MPHLHIRRCLNCQTKTHKRYWIEDACPVCKMATPYKESGHGGLTIEQIETLRQERETQTREVSKGSVERV